MSLENEIDLSACDVAHEDPARPGMKRRLKHAGMRCAGRLAAWQMGRPIATASNEFGILVYHRVSPEVEGLPAPYYNVPPDSFSDQLMGLQQLGFKFLALRDVLQRQERGEALPSRTVVVTFDDGYHSVYEHAFPVLQSLGIPATVFVCTAYLGADDAVSVRRLGTSLCGENSSRELSADELRRVRNFIEDGFN